MVPLRTQNLVSAAMIACVFSCASSLLRFPGVNAEVSQAHRTDCEVSRALESSEIFFNTMIEEFVTVSIAMVLGFGALHSLKTSMMHRANDSKASFMHQPKEHELPMTPPDNSSPPCETVPMKQLETSDLSSSSLDHSDASTVAGDSDGHAGDSDGNVDDSDAEDVEVPASTSTSTIPSPVVATNVNPKWDDKLSWRRAAALEHERLKHCTPSLPRGNNRQLPFNNKASTKAPAKLAGAPGPSTLSAGGLALLSLLREEKRVKLIDETSGCEGIPCGPPGLAAPACVVSLGVVRPPPGLEAFGPNQIP